MELITLENWKEILPVGTVFRSAVSEFKRTITEKTEAYAESDGIRVKNVSENTTGHGGPWIRNRKENCEIVKLGEKTNYSIY